MFNEKVSFNGQKSGPPELKKGAVDFHAMAEYLRSRGGTLGLEIKIHEDGPIGPLLRSREHVLRLRERG